MPVHRPRGDAQWRVKGYAVMRDLFYYFTLLSPRGSGAVQSFGSYPSGERDASAAQAHTAMGSLCLSAAQLVPPRPGSLEWTRPARWLMPQKANQTPPPPELVISSDSTFQMSPISCARISIQTAS
eukprot:1267039-Pleurochrysis_carterae.AAC.3